MKKLMLLAVAVLGLASLTACSSEYTDPAMVMVRYEGGPTEGGKFVECVKPGTKIVTNDSLYRYPTTQRQDDFNSDRYDPTKGATLEALEHRLT